MSNEKFIAAVNASYPESPHSIFLGSGLLNGDVIGAARRKGIGAGCLWNAFRYDDKRIGQRPSMVTVQQ